MNTLTVLVTKYLSKNNLSRNQLAQLLGYSNISKALRNLDHYCLTLIDKNQIALKLPEALNIPETEYQKAVNQVQSQFDAKARLEFKPSIHIIPSLRRSSIWGIPSLLNINIPDIKNCSLEQELQIIFGEYKNHQLNHYSKIYECGDYDEFLMRIEQMDQDGEKYPWTIGKGYRYFRTYDETIVFNRYGEIVDHILSQSKQY